VTRVCGKKIHTADRDGGGSETVGFVAVGASLFVQVDADAPCKPVDAYLMRASSYNANRWKEVASVLPPRPRISRSSNNFNATAHRDTPT